ncbi:probable phosphoglycerate mutase [Actinokineospora alba]|uniref:Probable phosphoglycerate mutase n=1 Tax=Actinokineospora alba TaxID=504798 RepID=A0A1H0WEK9_9PSEU|nr:histidine phosphatase family protein [Actinokineospora alba]SDI74973.1 probable phosphoglycerate mutase [Actinokineospora alba]SDP89003.1 probable phosphoglycerate mutase [Actinokineospora alba]
MIFLARHGETRWNRLGRKQGQLDSPLTESGLAQARNLAAAVGRLRVDGVFSSPLGRAATTAALCGVAFGMPVVVAAVPR